MMLKRLAITFFVLALLIAGYFAVVLNWSYSTGERAGVIQKLSDKGWVCKTWEGELVQAPFPGSPTVEKFPFTVRDATVAAEITKLMGRRVAVSYEEKVGLPTSCFGETRHYITKVIASTDITLPPGMVIQAAPTEAIIQPSPPPSPAK